MGLDWTTVALEILNFLVLVWLLTHFFYRPVLKVIEKRRADSAKTLTDAAALRQEAEALKAEYRMRLAEADARREQTLTALNQEIASERTRRLAQLDAELSAERERLAQRQARERLEREAALEREARAIAARFAAKFLQALSGPELDARLADLALAELRTRAANAPLPGNDRPLAQILSETRTPLRLESAHPLDAARRAEWSAELKRLAGRELTLEFSEDPRLVAGLCLSADAWMLRANLRDELRFFAEAIDHEH